ncbi:MAG: NifB/NifX family molybdenum-iron cluster-binding protein [Deltaproteobacteria bacterium]|nr:NifB/NifX family molybdenum-iron cluster-binding protein [Deltaproteobacteria bacterium]
MKIAVTSYGEELGSKVDRSFGRATWFVVIDLDEGTFQAHSNKQNVDAPQGAGIQAAQNIANLGADAVLTGNVGPNAFRTLNAASVKIFIFNKSVETVEEALSEWKAGRLQEITDATTEGHWV